MADFSKTITNSLNCFGPAPSSLWGVMVWSNTGLGRWGEGSEDHATRTQKLIEDAATFADSVAVTAQFNVSLNNELAMDGDAEDLFLRSGTGYLYVFPGPTTDADARPTLTYTQTSGGSASFTCAPVVSTSWS